jgi:pimeloyl-ACP methyl ester carboxylesterase
MDAPRIRHAQADGASIAYQTFGEGRRAIVMIPPFAHNIELIWEQPEAGEFFERLGAMGRVVHFDKRGCGRSDRRLPPAPELERAGTPNHTLAGRSASQ